MEEMGIAELYKFLNSDNNTIKINKNLFKIMGFEQAVFYSYLISECFKRNKQEDYKCFNDKIYYFSPVDEIEKVLNISAFKQRNILNQLEKKKLLTVKYGHARTRYVSINTNVDFVEEFIYEKNALHALEAKFIKFLNEQENQEIDSKYLMQYIQKRFLSEVQNEKNNNNIQNDVEKILPNIKI